MGIINRAVRNISRRKIRALLVVVALGFSMAIMVSIPAGVLANQKAASAVTSNLSNLVKKKHLCPNCGASFKISDDKCPLCNKAIYASEETFTD